MAPKKGSKGKSIDKSTDWSEFIWDDRGYWFSSRLDSSGQPEYDYRYPDAPQTAQQQQTIPRSPGPNVVSSGGIYDSSVVSGGDSTYPGQGNVTYPASSISTAGSPVYANSNYVMVSKPAYPPSESNYTTVAATNAQGTTGAIPGVSYSAQLPSFPSSGSNTSSYSSYRPITSSPETGYGSSSDDASTTITQSLGAISFSRQPTIPEQRNYISFPWKL